MSKRSKKGTSKIKTAFDVSGSDLPDNALEGTFDQPSQSARREVAEIDHNAAALNTEMKDALSFQADADNE